MIRRRRIRQVPTRTVVIGVICALFLSYIFTSVFMWGTADRRLERQTQQLNQQLQTLPDTKADLDRRTSSYQAVAKKVSAACNEPGYVRWQQHFVPYVRAKMAICLERKNRYQEVLAVYLADIQQQRIEQAFARHVQKANEAGSSLPGSEAAAQYDLWRTAYNNISKEQPAERLKPVKEQLLVAIAGIMDAWKLAESTNSYVHVAAAYDRLANVRPLSEADRGALYGEFADLRRQLSASPSS